MYGEFMMHCQKNVMLTNQVITPMIGIVFNNLIHTYLAKAFPPVLKHGGWLLVAAGPCSEPV